MLNIKFKWYKPAVSVAISAAILFTGTAAFAPAPAKAETVSVSASKAQNIINLGLKYRGTPYEFGAKPGQTRTFDCSSFVQYLYKRYGVSLPRTSRAQAKVGKYVSKSNLKKGDLVFFWTARSGKGKVGHVAIYMGNGKILHTYKKGIGVTVSNLNSSYWKSHYITARRVL
jgi:cell wall-associated NlpC family hydrolase